MMSFSFVNEHFFISDNNNGNVRDNLADINYAVEKHKATTYKTNTTCYGATPNYNVAS